MITRLSIALSVGILSAGITLGFVCWRDHSVFQFQNLAYQEFATPNPELGFEYIEAYRGPQSFYWQEIVASKEYKLEVLRQLGETPQNRWGLLNPASAERYLLFDREKKESLYLVVDLYDSLDPVAWGDDSAERFRAYAKAFVEVVNHRGVEVTPKGEIFFLSRDFASWKVRIRRHWLDFLLLGSISSLTTAFLLRKKPLHKPLQRTATSRRF